MQAIFDICVATWDNPHGLRELAKLGITPENVRKMIAETHKGWLAVTGEQAVGFAMGNKQTGEMWVIAVLKEYENRGIQPNTDHKCGSVA